MVDALARLKRRALPGHRARGVRRCSLPNFYRLHFHRHDHGLCVWAFDQWRDLRELPLLERNVRLEKPILAANANWLLCSESFDDGLRLLAEAERLGLEGVVSKRRDAPYRSGEQCGWIKISARRGVRQTRNGERLFERRS
jgi:ATP-dependent DNA ligase